MSSQENSPRDPYAGFRTNKDLEREGIYLDYGSFRIKGRRAGGANVQFAKALNRAMRPHRREVQTETLDDRKAQAILIKSFIEGVIVGWEVKDGDTWQPGVYDPETKEVVAPTPEAYARVFEAMPDLFTDVREQFGKAGLFLEQVRDTDAGN